MRPMCLRVFLTCVLVGVVAAFCLVPGALAQTLATFEAGHAFQAEDHVIALAASTDWASQGSRSLKITHGSIPAGTANRLWIRVMEDLSWVGATHVQADFFVPPGAPHEYSAALMIQVGDGWTWYESAAVPLAPGENRDVTFRLDNTDWRSAATAWSLGATAPLSGIRAYGFLVFSDHRDPGVVYLDNVRLVRPATVAEEAGAALPAVGIRSFEQYIRISGKAELKVVSQPKAVPGQAPQVAVGLIPALWEINPGSGRRPDLVTTTDMDGKTVQALEVKGLASGQTVRVDLGGADMSAYKYLYMDIKQVGGTGSKGLQFILQDSGWSYHDTQHFPHVPADGWYRAVLTADQFTNSASFDDVKVVGFRTWDGDADFLIANVYFAGEAEDEETVTELSRTHEITLTLDYDVTPQWSLKVGAVMADPVIRLGVVELRGSDGPLSLRAFHNGKAGDLGDPLKLFLASKYHENHTTGLEATALAGPASLKAMILRPSDNDPAKDRIGAAILDLPVGRAASASLLAVNQSVPGETSKTSIGAAGKAALGRVTLTGELVSTASQDEGRAWMLEASTPVSRNVDVTLHAREYGKGVIPTYNDHAKHNGYGQRHIDAKWKISESLDAGLYLQNWYRTDDSWNEFLNKLSLNWRGPGVSLASFVETKRLLDDDGKYAFRSRRTSLRAASKLAGLFDVTGLVWLDKTASGDSLPTYLARLSFEPLSQTVLTLEAAQVKTDASADPTRNLYAKIARKIPGGELSIAFGKPTLNDDEDAHESTETAKEYVEVKLEVEF